MTTSNLPPKLMNALLALDVYNRGQDSGLNNVALNGYENGLGNFTISGTTDPFSTDDAAKRAASFAAATYTAGSQIVIAYRGTDQRSTDISTGYGVGIGGFKGQQATMAIEYFKQAAQVSAANPYGLANVTVTGHSMGGGYYGDAIHIGNYGDVIHIA